MATTQQQLSIATLTAIDTQINLVPYYDKGASRTILAVYHNDYRHVWIEQHDPASYRHNRIQGDSVNDITCYYRPHRDWGPDRNDWPAILFQYEAPDCNNHPMKPNWLYTQEGWLVLDYKSRPVLDYAMPLTLSSMCEDYVLEAIMRTNHLQNINVSDITARMPGKINAQGKEPYRTGTISMRMNRFRRHAACISWGPKMGSQIIQAFLDELMPAQCKTANSTRSFRNLEPYEEAAIEMINVGLFPNKARKGKQDLSEQKKQEMYKKSETKYLRQKAVFDDENPGNSESARVTAIIAQLRAKATALGSGVPSRRKARLTTSQNDEAINAAVDDANKDADGANEDADADADADANEDADADADADAEDYDYDDDAENYFDDEDAEENAEADDANTADSSSSDEDATPSSQAPDLRHFIPSTPHHQHLNALLLVPTLSHYAYLTRSRAPATNALASYQQQYEYLQRSFDHYAPPVYQGVTLVGLMQWTRNSVQYNAEWKDEMFGRRVDLGRVSALMGLAGF